ncbi:hypothetical protein [Alteribacter aurantiacus]|uniref:hypothetical protein n=1 Tax=Alteribacter aurantiacus TaxID=254410 RepID=UPI0003F9E7A7|nr:hypothetical protein [Alteribacter aurantiacus]
MTAYRKRMFRGAKIEDCILDFSKMAETAEKDKIRVNEDEAMYCAGMNAAFTFVVNRLAREFDYSRGDEQMVIELERLKVMFEKKVEESIKQSKENIGIQVDDALIDQIPEEAKKELRKIPAEFQQGMFEGIALSYEEVAKSIDSLLKTVKKKDTESIEALIDRFKESAEVNRKKANGHDQSYREGLFQGIVAGYEIAAYEISETYNFSA